MEYFDEFLSFLKEDGIEKLYNHQKESIRLLDEGKSVILSTPTSSGKSLVAYYGIIRAWKKGMKSLYSVPLRALAEEKWNELRFFSRYGMKIMISTGDYDETSTYLKNYDVVISTSEKIDSILRNNPQVFEGLGFVVFDEIHNIMDETRGHTLEIVITKMRYMFENIQFLAMSATVNNISEISEWLNSLSVISNFRPVPLSKFIIAGEYVYDENGRKVDEIESLEKFIPQTLEDGGQTLIFVNSRKATEKFAEKISNEVNRYLSDEDRRVLSELDLGDEGSLNHKLYSLLRKGVGYHHAGMLSEQRRLVEKFFREGHLKLVVATTTLAAGMNLPARSVIIKDIFRYNGFSSDMIPNFEIQQMLGRAGRIKYDRLGNGYIYSSKTRIRDVFNYYINGELENIESKIDEGKLRMHVLGLISSNLCRDKESLKNFFNLTLASKQGKDLDSWIDEALDFLNRNEMIKGNERLRATPFGKRVSELYIDPVSGVILRKLIDEADIDNILLGISITPDMPQMYVGENDAEVFRNLLSANINADEGQIKVALVLRDWINEVPEDSIVERYNIWPADIRNRVEIADWLSHSLYEISKVFGKARTDLRILNYRISNGVREDIIPLTFVPNVGRVRARRLMINGYDLSKLANANPADIQKIAGFGEKISENIIRDARKILDKGVTFGLSTSSN